MYLFDWSALKTTPEGYPGQHSYTYVICILATSLTSLSDASSLGIYLYGVCADNLYFLQFRLVYWYAI
jgi:hypothetical protein